MITITTTAAWAKIREWTLRYAPVEISGTISAVIVYFLVLRMGTPPAVAAIAASVGETLGYYGVALVRECKRYWPAGAAYGRLQRIRLCIGYSLRGLLVEYGVAELIDSIAIRPALFYMVPQWLGGHVLLGLLTAKLLADLFFYGFAVAGYELRKRLFA
jgi:hypothetical protein